MAGQRLPDSELEIMLIIWQAGRPVTRMDIESRMERGRELSPTALLSFLSRLEKRGYVRVEKDGKNNVYTALVDESRYRQEAGRTFLQKLYGNSVTNFVAALYDGDPLPEEEVSKLYRYLEEKERENDV